MVPWCPAPPQLGPAAACTTGYGAAAPPAAAAQWLAGPRTVQCSTPDLALLSVVACAREKLE